MAKRKTEKYRFPLVVVRWLDAQSIEGWTQDVMTDSSMECLSVGWMFHSMEEGAKDRVILIQTHDNVVQEKMNILHIPRGMVKSITVIVEAADG